MLSFLYIVIELGIVYYHKVEPNGYKDKFAVMTGVEKQCLTSLLWFCFWFIIKQETIHLNFDLTAACFVYLSSFVESYYRLYTRRLRERIDQMPLSIQNKCHSMYGLLSRFIHWTRRNI